MPNQSNDQVLLDTINNLNQQIKSCEHALDYFIDIEHQKIGMEHAVFVMLYEIQELNEKAPNEINQKVLLETINRFGELAINGFMNREIQNEYPEEVKKGSDIAKTIADQIEGYENIFKHF